MNPQASPRILFIDNYDSFTYNVRQLLLDTITGCQVIVVRNDTIDRRKLLELVDYFDAVVVGPGPGRPDMLEDVHVIPDLWNIPPPKMLPVLGICLGMQSLCVRFGGQLKQLSTVKHGQVSSISHCGEDIFMGIGEFHATLYHSLFVDVADIEKLKVLGHTNDAENGFVTMSVRHVTYPFWGVQYHPDSACSEKSAHLIHNWWKLVQSWNKLHQRVPMYCDALFNYDITPVKNLAAGRPKQPQVEVSWRCIEQSLDAAKVCTILDAKNSEKFAMLESRASPGEWTVIGVLDETTTEITHVVGAMEVELHSSSSKRKLPLSDSVWSFLAEWMAQKRVCNGPKDSPFVGGLIGYIDYEAGVDTIQVNVQGLQRRPQYDIDLLFVDRSIVIHESGQRTFIQSTRTDDEAWLQCMQEQLENIGTIPVQNSSPVMSPPSVVLPNQETYQKNILKAKDYLNQGDSYELCLTAQTTVTLLSPRNPWDMYLDLRRTNPAPYGSFLKLSGACLLGSSPERFLSWTKDGLCELRPIKGTVKKCKDMCFQTASCLLNTPKERAENLMIVDLIRHDLHQIADNVHVAQLMTVEEYKNVFQLVSVIRGQVAHAEEGFNVLCHSLPPGSMTGAPKKRSVELLQNMEQSPRGVYSGVCGYWSLCGNGDWSVIIRSAFQYHDDPPELWRVSAGGAITALSDVNEEWEEMKTKLASILQIFGVDCSTL